MSDNTGLQPSGDIQVLDDYRARHALYRSDPGLQALSASAPLIAIWDDHEFMNNVSPKPQVEANVQELTDTQPIDSGKG